MTSYRQFEANRRNAQRSTGPKTEDGKRQSRANAVRHGLTSETVIGSLEDSEDYKAFEAAVTAGYCAETAVERELVLRLASLLWRLRRATAIETALLEIQAEILRNGRHGFELPKESENGPQSVVYRSVQAAVGAAPPNCAGNGLGPDCGTRTASRLRDGLEFAPNYPSNANRQLAYCFVRLETLGGGAFERLNRYEAALWRQTVQTLLALQPAKQR